MSRPLPYRCCIRIFATLSILTAPFAVSAQTEPVSSQWVGPGVTHAKYLLPGPLAVDVLSVSLNEPSVRIESYRPDHLTRTTVQSAANDREGHRVLGAVNADFFSFQTGWPVGNQLVDGMWVLGTRSIRSHLAIDTKGRPHIQRLSFAGSVTTSTGRSASIMGMNLSRRGNGLVVYTSFRTAIVDTDSVHTAVTLRFITPALTAGDTLLAVASPYDSTADRTLTPGTAVLSASSGDPAAFIATEVRAGDTLKLVFGTDPALHGITQIIGGCGRFLAGGRDVTDSTSGLEGITTRFTGARHPRTFVGFDRDTTLLYICTVDGRQASSIGMTFADMFAFLHSLGASEGFNLDGGGSTTMVVRGRIVNSPSDATGERPVANSLQVICTAPDGDIPAPPEP